MQRLIVITPDLIYSTNSRSQECLSQFSTNQLRIPRFPTSDVRNIVCLNFYFPFSLSKDACPPAIRILAQWWKPNGTRPMTHNHPNLVIILRSTIKGHDTLTNHPTVFGLAFCTYNFGIIAAEVSDLCNISKFFTNPSFVAVITPNISKCCMERPFGWFTSKMLPVDS